jgi:hypothetical protein
MAAARMEKNNLENILQYTRNNEFISVIFYQVNPNPEPWYSCYG